MQAPANPMGAALWSCKQRYLLFWEGFGRR